MTESAWPLLCDPSPALRCRVLRELLDVPPDDPELVDLLARRYHDREALALLESEPGGLQELSHLLCRLGRLGLDRQHPRVAELVERVFAHRREDGSFPLTEFRTDDRYTMIPLQAALPLRGLGSVGAATDSRAEKSYAWLLERRTEDGSWPTGLVAGQPGGVPGYRKLPGSPGCRANTEAALAALVLHPAHARSEPARRAADLLLRRETRDEWALGTEIARLHGRERAAGFISLHARFDLAFVLELVSRTGVSARDARVTDLVDFLDGLRGPAGLWEHPAHPLLSRWLTLDLLVSMRRLRDGDWTGDGPRLRFRPGDIAVTHH
ncbi:MULTISPECIES: prenyltransferase/squalene oxidase repeat-containing protein [Streptomyces]|uniref:hypothetical protein n=1 Tax=Streptomyces TaxID=1883 RepID=UPI001E51BAAA|nr:hypothetical protein [Streptomyces sp. CMSTAAHL-2]MCE3034954.1 hypothetical protein [Streptomyces sp. CMSTAAHL-2]